MGSCVLLGVSEIALPRRFWDALEGMENMSLLFLDGWGDEDVCLCVLGELGGQILFLVGGRVGIQVRS